MTCKLRTVAIFMVVFLSACVFTYGIDYSYHGYASQQYLKTTGNNYLADDSKDGSFEFNEIGLNLSASFTDSIRGGFQLLSRDFGEAGNNDLKLDWGFVEYKPLDQIGISAGKIKLPFGLYNKSRDVDMIRTPITLPQSVYLEDLRDVLVAFTGVSVHGFLFDQLMYEVYKGNAEVDDDIPFFVDLISGLFPFVVSGLETEVTDQVGGALTWFTPLDGLRAGISYVEADLEFDLDWGLIPFPITKVNFEVRDWFVYSLEYSYEDLTIAAELSQMEYTFIIPGVGSSTMDLQGYYVQADYRINELVELGTYYSVYYSHTGDKSGKRFSAVGQPDYKAWMKDWALYARFDIKDWWIVKVEYHTMDGATLPYDMWNPTGLKEDWETFSIKTSFNF
jgi:hypothetical protein